MSNVHANQAASEKGPTKRRQAVFAAYRKDPEPVELENPDGSIELATGYIQIGSQREVSLLDDGVTFNATLNGIASAADAADRVIILVDSRVNDTGGDVSKGSGDAMETMQDGISDEWLIQTIEKGNQWDLGKVSRVYGTTEEPGYTKIKLVNRSEAGRDVDGSMADTENTKTGKGSIKDMGSAAASTENSAVKDDRLTFDGAPVGSGESGNARADGGGGTEAGGSMAETMAPTMASLSLNNF